MCVSTQVRQAQPQLQHAQIRRSVGAKRDVKFTCEYLKNLGCLRPTVASELDALGDKICFRQSVNDQHVVL
eukprot:265155-Prymnesium_polylepis.1